MKDRFGFDWTGHVGTQFWRRPQIGRRMFFEHAASAVGGYFLLPALTETVARAAVTPRKSAKNCIFIVMSGGPSQVDTFDLKEGAWTPSNFEPTSYGDIRWPRGLLPTLAGQLDSLAFARSVKAWALVHVLAKSWVQIGRNPAAAASRFAPHIGSVVSLELGANDPSRTLPAFVALNSTSGPGNGYLAPDHSPFYISPGGTGLANTKHGDGTARFDRRYALMLQNDPEAAAAEFGVAMAETRPFTNAARKLMYNNDVDAMFTFDQNERNRYGNTGFGNSCIAARNMLRAKSGVRFIQINQSDWDHHENIYVANSGHYAVAKQFDLGLGTLIADLKKDGLLDDTLVVAIGEFGRVPGALNSGKGRDHYVQQTAVFAGGGVKGGRLVGSTDKEGKGTLDPGWLRKRDIRAEDVEATIYSALGIDWTTVRKDDPSGRGFEYVPFSDRDLYGPIDELFG